MLDIYEEIVMDFTSPICVIAGPGAGKTRLLADRVTRLLKKKNGVDRVDKDNVMILAFGKDASARMKSELTNPNEPWKLKDDELPHISTMHSLGLEIVKKCPRIVGLLRDDPETQDDDKVKQLMFRDATLLLGLDGKDGKEATKQAIKCKEHGDCNQKDDETKCQICRKYWEIMRKCNRIDFDDMVLFACEILEQNPNLLEEYRSKAKYLLVDEYQDINAAQFRLIHLLSEGNPDKLLVVGDDAQTIYSFRGADPKFILGFEQMFPKGKIRTLPYSHRCPKEIMEDALKILKKYYTAYKGIKNVDDLIFDGTSGERPFIIPVIDEDKEAERAALIARDSLREGKDVLILIPDKRFFPGISKKLRECGVPYDFDKSLLPDRMVVLNRFLDWFKQPADNFLTRLVIEDIINEKAKKQTSEQKATGKKKIAKLWEFVNEENDLFSIIQKLDDKEGTVEVIRKSLNDLLNLYNETDTDKCGEFIKVLSDITGIWTNANDFADDLSYVQELLRPTEIAVNRLVRLRTMRKAKGLQADVVIMVALEKDIVPAPYADNPIEDARLFYVSMTRARQKLYLLHAWKRSPKVTYDKRQVVKRPRSPFLDILRPKRGARSQ